MFYGEYFSATSRRVAALGQSEQGSNAAQAVCNANRSLFDIQRQVRHKGLVRSGQAIVGLSGRHGQAAADHFQRKIVKRRAMIKKMLARCGRCCRKLSSHPWSDRRCPATPDRTMVAGPPQSFPTRGHGPDRSPVAADETAG